MNLTSPHAVTPLILHAPDADAFAPFGSFVHPPQIPGQRAYYSNAIDQGHADCDLSLHVNHVRPSSLPLSIAKVERHPHSAQAFLPLDLSQYLIVAMPSDSGGLPDVTRAAAWLLPSSIGVIYHANVWHAGATVLDRKGHFAVVMWRARTANNDEIREIEPLTVLQGAELNAGGHHTEQNKRVGG